MVNQTSVTVKVQRHPGRRPRLHHLLLITHLLTGSLFLFIQPEPGCAQNPDERYLVEGDVSDRDSGTLLSKTTIHLKLAKAISPEANAAAPKQASYSVLSDNSGHFRFEAVTPGEYVLSGERDGYLTTEFGSSTVHRHGSLIAVQANINNVQLQLVPGGVISGTIFDDEGKPVTTAQ